MDESKELTEPPAGPIADPDPTLGAPLRERVLELIALLTMIALAAVVFKVAGAVAFGLVTSGGLSLFLTWRALPPRR